MAVIALDTHAVVKELQAAGFTEPQAEALTRAVRKAQDVDLSTLATKADLAVLKTDLRAIRNELDLLRLDTKTEIGSLRQSAKAEIDSLRQSTKADIDSLRQSTKADIDGLRLSTRSDIAELKADLLKWLVGAIGIQTIVILSTVVALIRLLPR